MTGKRFNPIRCLLLLPILAGCVNQHAEVQTYRDVVDEGLKRPNSYQPGQPLSLRRALALANEDNETIAINGENYLQALINKNRVVASFLPTVSLQPNYTIEQKSATNSATLQPINGNPAQPSATAGGFIARGSTLQRTEVPVVGALNVNPVANIANVANADELVIQQRQLLLDAQATVLLNVAQAYYQVLRSESQRHVLQDSLATQEARLRDVQGRFKNHLALALEVSQTVSEVAATRVALVQSETDVRNGRRALAFLIGVPAIDGPLSDDVIVPARLIGVEIFRRQAAEHRLDLLAAASGVRAAKTAVDAAIDEYYPSVSLNVAGFLYREDFSSASKWDAILIANIPVFSAGVIEANVRTAWSKLRQAALFQAMLKRQIDQDVQTAYDNLLTADVELQQLDLEVQAADDALHQSEQLLKNGLAIPLDVLTAQDTLLNAQLLLTSESFDRSVFYLDLLRITGQLDVTTAGQWPTSRPD